MIYGMSSQKDEDEPIYTKVTLDYHQAHHKVTISFVQSIVKLITWPFTSFALLVDNAYIQNARRLRINMVHKQRLFAFNQKNPD